MYVDPLVEEIVSTPQDVMKLLGKGNEGRKVGATDWVSLFRRAECIMLTYYRMTDPLDLTACSLS